MKNETHFPIVGFLAKQTLGIFSQIGMSFILASLLIVLQHEKNHSGHKRLSQPSISNVHKNKINHNKKGLNFNLTTHQQYFKTNNITP